MPSVSDTYLLDINKLRFKIDKIDSEICRLLQKRLDCVQEFAQLKKDHNKTTEFYLPKREKEILDKLKSFFENSRAAEIIQNIYSGIFAASRAIQKEFKVATLKNNKNTLFMALTHFGPYHEFVPCDSITKTVELLSNKHCNYAIIPLCELGQVGNSNNIERYETLSSKYIDEDYCILVLSENK